MTDPIAPRAGGLPRVALAQAVGAYVIWGMLPIYFKTIGHVAALEVVAHRVIWSVVFLLVLLWLRRRLPALREALTTPRLFWPMAGSAVLIALNWLIYIWAVNNDHVTAASLGYFLNPLLNVLLGFLILKERLGRAQVAAVALAGVGVAVLAAGAFSTLWISVSLALSFGFYGLIRKLAAPGPMVGLATETIILLPAALVFLAWWEWQGVAAFGQIDRGTDLLLIAGGVITAVPLLLFASAARRLRYAAIGLIQYIGPSIQFALAILVYREPLTTAHYIAFPLIWAGLILYSLDALRHARRTASGDEAPA